MPLFFFLSGLFFYDSLTKRGRIGLLANKVDKIIYPYIVWSLLQGFCEVILSDYTNGHVSAGEVLSFAWRPRAQFWFLYGLFQIFVVCLIVYARAQQRYFLPLAVCFGLLYVFKPHLPVNAFTIFILDNAVFFAVGIWFNEIQSLFKARTKELTLIFGTLFVAGQYFFHFTLGLNYKIGGMSVLALAVISIFFVVSVSMWIGQVQLKWLLFLGTSSMTIYLMHILAGSGTRIALNKMGIDSVGIQLMLGTLIGLSAPLLAQIIIKRFNLNFLLTPPRSISATVLCLRKAGTS